MVPAFAILRLNTHLEDPEPTDQMSVIRIVWTRERAEAEVRRLNALPTAVRCPYFWRHTRAEIEGDE